MLEMARKPIVLDFDRSVGGLDGCDRIDLSAWQEAIRFGCSWNKLGALKEALDARMPPAHGTVLFGSGDYHHLSYLLLARLAASGPFQLIVFDNHPDNMRYPFGIHCGSWIRWASRLPFITHVHVVGITSTDVSGAHWWENNLRPLFSKPDTYWCMDVDVRWARRLGLAHAFEVCAEPDELLERFARHVKSSTLPAYFSIDKDVLSAEVARTNWDQGRLLDRHLLEAIALFRGRLIGSDINGEVSTYRYRTWWKRWLSNWDGQEPPPSSQIDVWQREHLALNRRFLAAFDAASRPLSSISFTDAMSEQS